MKNANEPKADSNEKIESIKNALWQLAANNAGGADQLEDAYENIVVKNYRNARRAIWRCLSKVGKDDISILRKIYDDLMQVSARIYKEGDGNIVALKINLENLIRELRPRWKRRVYELSDFFGLSKTRLPEIINGGSYTSRRLPVLCKNLDAEEADLAKMDYEDLLNLIIEKLNEKFPGGI